MERSTRLSILEHALADVVDRLSEMPATSATALLRERARQYEVEIGMWRASPPDEAQRTSLLKQVLDLNVEVIRAGGTPSSPPPPDDDSDDDFPRSI